MIGKKKKQFEALNKKREERSVKVVLDGREQLIDVHTVVVGDIVLLEPGDNISCDGVFLSGHNVWCDESSARGESDAIKKLSYEECIALRDMRIEEFDPDSPVGDGESTSGPRRNNPSGLGIFVGTKSFNGRIMIGLSPVPPCI
jgi:Ca2+-transporting ATPase